MIFVFNARKLVDFIEMGSGSVFYPWVVPVLTLIKTNNYVKRIRLQRAGSMLISDHQRPVSEVSALCGFNSTAVFCRAFRAHFGRSTGEFRD
ncbi:MAG: hypothetical protein DRI97_08905, partial [Bacteroidetes bacterium]